jgi:two-component system nitrogen regulation sensor histidine kinase NtrY
MTSPQQADFAKEVNRRRRERRIILITIPLIVLLTYLESHFFRFGGDLPGGGNIVILALMNINVILLIFLLYLVTRNVVKLFFERKRRIFGHRLRTKLVIAFIALSLMPTVILFGLATQFISTSMEYWYNIQVEQSLKKSLEVGKRIYEDAINRGLSVGNRLSGLIKKRDLLSLTGHEPLRTLVQEARRNSQLQSIEITSRQRKIVTRDSSEGLSPVVLRPQMSEVFQRVLKTREAQSQIIASADGDLVCTASPVIDPGDPKKVNGLVVTATLLPRDLLASMAEISQGFENYQQMKMLKNPIKLSHLIMFSIVTLLIVFSASWFGFYLARTITVPIQELAEGTRRIAGGDLDVHIDQDTDDEIGTLVDSFNQMTLDLQASQKALEATNQELRRSSEEVERRRRYMETVLRNVAAGVISVDAGGHIQTINQSAESIFGVRAEDVIQRHYTQFLQGDQREIVNQFIEGHRLTKQKTLQRQVRSAVGSRLMTLLVTASMLHDDEGQFRGMVVVFDDLTELEKAQRMAAWREVARRIAHEIKNPLTPIQLSAQRLRRKYLQHLSPDGKLFDECTRTIIKQVEELKHLVNEFSTFARMPTANPTPNSLEEIVQEALTLFRESHPSTRFLFQQQNPLPLLDLDREQMKRVMINLLDNAVAAVTDDGEIQVTVSFDEILKIVRVEVADNGPGIPAEDKIRMFEPYFSTKEKGSGLGLAIVSNIVADHHGFIRVRDNHPRGTIIVIELPGGTRGGPALSVTERPQGRGA